MKFFFATLFLFLVQTGLGYGSQASFSSASPGTSTLGYTCTDEDGDRKCICTGVSDCNRMKDSGICRTQTGAHTWEDDTECNDKTNTCECTWPREGRSRKRRPDRVGGDEKLAPDESGNTSDRVQESDAAKSSRRNMSERQRLNAREDRQQEITAPNNRSDRRNENVSARRGESSKKSAENRELEEMQSEAEELEHQLHELEGGNPPPSEPDSSKESDSVAATISDPILDTLEPVAGEIGESVGGVVESIEDAFDDLINGDSDSEDERDQTVDHRTGRTPPPARRNEKVRARRGKLPAPTNLTLTDIKATSLVIRWRDNAKSEDGVHVERGAPVFTGAKRRIAWRRVFSSEERVEDRIRGVGERTDVDDGLTRGARYCYRLQAYRSNAVSDYSEIACATLRERND